jgi:hypothetical protein
VKDWAYIERQPVGEYELYNLRTDPECFRNLAGQPKYADVQQRHNEQIKLFFPEQAGKAKSGKRADGK